MKKTIILSIFLALLFVSCSNNKKESTEKVISISTETGLPPLHQAIIDNDEPKVIKLIKNCADVNQLDGKMGNAPLHLAAQGDNPRMIKTLIDNGAFVNLQTPRAGHTPLMVATWYSKKDNIKELLKANDINIFIRTPYGGAMAVDLIGGGDSNLSENDKKRYKILKNIFEGYEKELKAKIDCQKIYQVVIDNDLPLPEKEQRIKDLIDNGEPVNTESLIIGTANDRHSALLVAARNGYTNIVQLLLEAGADFNQRGYMMNSIAFHKAAYMGNSEVMKLLVKHKDAQKFINDQGINNGYTPLHDAIWHGNTEAARILIKSGARLDVKTYEGDTPLDLAKRYQYTDIVELMSNDK